MPNLASGLQWAETAVMYRRKSSLAGKVYLVKKSHLKTAFSRRQKSASPQFGRTWMPNCCSTFSKQDIWDFMNLCNMHTQSCVTSSKWLHFLCSTICFPQNQSALLLCKFSTWLNCTGLGFVMVSVLVLVQPLRWNRLIVFGCCGGDVRLGN